MQREVEGIAFEHRQRIMREDERLRAWKAEAQSALDAREVGQAASGEGVKDFRLIIFRSGAPENCSPSKTS